MHTVIKNWGYELWIENNNLYCGKHLHIIPNKKCSVHYHKIKKETFYIISGSLVLEYSQNLGLDAWESNQYNKIILNTGEFYTIDPYTAHRFYTHRSTPCDFIEISTHHDDKDSFRIIPSSL